MLGMYTEQNRFDETDSRRCSRASRFLISIVMFFLGIVTREWSDSQQKSRKLKQFLVVEDDVRVFVARSEFVREPFLRCHDLTKMLDDESESSDGPSRKTQLLKPIVTQSLNPIARMALIMLIM